MKSYLSLILFIATLSFALPDSHAAGRGDPSLSRKGDLPSITIMTPEFKVIADRCNSDGIMEGITMTKFGKPEQYIEAKSALWEFDEEDGVTILLKDVVVIHFSKSPRNTFNSIVKYESQYVKVGNGVIQLVINIHGKDKKVRLVKGKEVLIHENKLWLLQGIILEMDYSFLPEGHPRHYKRMAFSALLDSDSSQIREHSWVK